MNSLDSSTSSAAEAQLMTPYGNNNSKNTYITRMNLTADWVMEIVNKRIQSPNDLGGILIDSSSTVFVNNITKVLRAT